MEVVGGALRGCVRVAQTRRVWSSKEKEVLEASLKHFLTKGWKTDNGFWLGYLARLEEAMNKAFPGTDLKGSPHINSKLITWKRTHFILQGALTRSDVGFNESTNMINCTDEVWQHVVQADKAAENLYYKQFPLYPMWIEFCGKDRANGHRAEDVLDVVINLIREDQLVNAPHPGDYRVSLDHIMDAHDEDSVCGGDELAKFDAKPGNKKRKANTIEKMCDMVSKLVKNTDKIDDIATYIGYEHKLGENRTHLDALLSEILDLTLNETFNLGDLFVKDSDRLEYFAKLAMEKRSQYIRQLLDRLSIG